MPFVAVPNVAEFVCRASLSGQQIVNTFYGLHTTTFDDAMLVVAAETLAETWHDNMLPLLGSAYEFEGVHARGLRTAVDIEADALDFNANGSGGTDTLPNNVALAVSRRTGLAGRSARGRVFISGIPYSHLADQTHVSSGYADAVVAALNGIRAAWLLEDWLEVIVSRVTNGLPNIPPISRLVDEYLNVDTAVDSMRRRLAGRGS